MVEWGTIADKDPNMITIDKNKTGDQEVIEEFIDYLQGDSKGDLLEREVKDYGRDELSLLEYPIAFLSRKQPTEDQLQLRKKLSHDENPDPYELVIREKRRLPSGKIVEAVYSIKAKDKEIGFPTASANRTWVGIISLAKKKNNFQQNPVRFAERELIEERGNEVNPYYRKVVREDLKRLRNIDISGVYTFYDAKERRLAEATTSYSPIADFRIVSVNGRILPGDVDKELSWIQFGETIYMSMKNGGVKKLNKKELYSLKPDFDQLLYRYLDKRRNSKEVKRAGGVFRCDFVNTVYHKLGQQPIVERMTDDGEVIWNHTKARQKVRSAVKNFKKKKLLGIKGCAFKKEPDPVYHNEVREALYFYFDTQGKLDYELSDGVPPVFKALVEKGLMRDEDATKIWLSKWDYLTAEARERIKPLRDQGLSFEQYARDMIAYFEHERSDGKVKQPKSWVRSAIRGYYADEEFEAKKKFAEDRAEKKAAEVEQRAAGEQKLAEVKKKAEEYDRRFSELSMFAQGEIRRRATEMFEQNVGDFMAGKYRGELRKGKSIDEMSPTISASYRKHRNQLMDSPEFAELMQEGQT